MAQTALTGQDTLIINGRIITALADATAVDLTFPTDIAAVKRGKDGNTIYAKNEEGRKAMMTIRLLLSSSDSIYLNSVLQQWKQSSSDFVLMTGAYYKRSGDGKGIVSTRVHQLTGGVFKKLPEALTNVEGNTDQSVAVWDIIWGDCDISDQ
jgi:hypothetical protein